ncbi:hypothetical protein CEXT_579291 [Caerostris extrusa]|uniref:Secreted protein n=1 Tax=Caerostris extrusa TaxID=172846 RepID=A0AAV4XF13_CAEEX|nr:hypothetical protein CEXT_579291 [Caerostris extrusa]
MHFLLHSIEIRRGCPLAVVFLPHTRALESGSPVSGQTGELWRTGSNASVSSWAKKNPTVFSGICASQQGKTRPWTHIHVLTCRHIRLLPRKKIVGFRLDTRLLLSHLIPSLRKSL